MPLPGIAAAILTGAGTSMGSGLLSRLMGGAKQTQDEGLAGQQPTQTQSTSIPLLPSMDTLKDVGLDFAKSAGKGIQQEGVNRISDAFGRMVGPREKNSQQLGADARAYMNAAYPGTTPWEQLGGGGHGAGGTQGPTAGARIAQETNGS